MLAPGTTIAPPGPATAGPEAAAARTLVPDPVSPWPVQRPSRSRRRATPEHEGTTYRPELDGIRTVAVYVVLLFHCGVATFAGGFVGVDVFFVLSGFLITRLLLTEWGRSGRISLPRFYARRARRLLPAAWVALVLGSLAVAAVLPVTEIGPMADSVRASFLWFANWHFVSVGNDYFAAGDATSPFLHFWSLSLEEQFYVFWPPLMIGLLALSRRLGWSPRRVLGGFAVVVIALSVLSLVRFSASDPAHAYYGTDTRAYQMLAGGLLAIVTTPFVAAVVGGRHRKAAGQRRRARPDRAALALQVGGLVAVLVLATSLVDVGPTARGLLVSAAAVALLTGLELAPRGAAGRLLGRPWAARLGRVSYGTYLWHFPVIVVVQALTDLPAVATALIVAPVATGIAGVSATLVEQPIRRSRTLARMPWRTIGVALAVSLLLGLLTPLALDRGASVASPAGRSITSVGGYDLVAAKRDGGVAPDCYGKPVDTCVVVDSGPAAPRIALVGDSHARSLIFAFEALARQNGWTMLATIGSGCPWQYGMLYPRSWGAQTDRCRVLQKDWYERVLPKFGPDVTYVASYSFDDPNGPQVMRPFLASDKGLGGEVLAGVSTDRAVGALRAMGSAVVIVDPFPVASPGDDPVACLGRGTAPADCAYRIPATPVPAEQRYAALAAAAPDVRVVDLDRVVCPDLPVCDAVRDGLVTHRDGNHVTASFFQLHRDQVYGALATSGALPRGR